MRPTDISWHVHSSAPQQIKMCLNGASGQAATPEVEAEAAAAAAGHAMYTQIQCEVRHAMSSLSWLLRGSFHDSCRIGEPEACASVWHFPCMRHAHHYTSR